MSDGDPFADPFFYDIEEFPTVSIHYDLSSREVTRKLDIEVRKLDWRQTLIHELEEMSARCLATVEKLKRNA